MLVRSGATEHASLGRSHLLFTEEAPAQQFSHPSPAVGAVVDIGAVMVHLSVDAVRQANEPPALCELSGDP
jgi:hypothetical protein